ncbi:MAG: hypothetical protein IKW81_14335 [Pseudobutyrivibrio sp.]|nr:hypothetical protein [Pseudobutyrivibrio sp.]
MMRFNVKNPLFILAAGLLLVAGSAFGSTKAEKAQGATVESVEFQTAKISAKLQEKQGENYVDVAGVKVHEDGTTEDFANALLFKSLANVKAGSELLKVENPYEEKIQVLNDSDGEYPEYIRVVVRKYWVDEENKKDSSLDPTLIKLDVADGWGAIESDSHEEVVYYYRNPVNQTTEANKPVDFVKSITFDRRIKDDHTTTITKTPVEGGTLIESTGAYGYNGKSFVVEMRVDAVQAHSGAEAMHGAWGVEAGMDSNGKLNSIDGKSF